MTWNRGETESPRTRLSVGQPHHRRRRATRRLDGPNIPNYRPKEKGTLKGSACLSQKDAYLAPRMASLAALATRNFTTRLAGMLMGWPVAGLRPMRAARFTSTSLPRPGRVKVFFACL